MKLRDYQVETVEALWSWFGEHREGNPVVGACVGAGKSVLIAECCSRAALEYPGTRSLVIVHQKELMQQNAGKLRQLAPHLRVGLYSAAAGRKDLGCQITVATIGSVYKDAKKLGRIDLVHCDEAHMVNSKETGMWRAFLKDLKALNPHVRVVGWTGTEFRGNGVFLTDSPEALFTHVAHKVTIRQLLDLGFLAPLVSAHTVTKVDTDDVRVSGNDFVVSELAKVTDKEELVASTCREIVQLAAGRKSWLVFAVTVEHAHHVADELTRLGVKAAVVSGETPTAERDSYISMFRRQTLQCLVNVGVLTTGFDAPSVDFIGLLRATKSPVLYVQMAGRGMRCVGQSIEESIANGKPNCLWADFTDTTARLGPVDAITGRPRGGGHSTGEAPFKICDTCGSQNPTAALKCSSCNAAFPEPERIRHIDEASSHAIMSDQLPAVRAVEVTEVRYRKHLKAGSSDTLRVEYWADLNCIAKEWVCLSHQGFARRKAERWWQERSNIPHIPSSTQDAIDWLAYDEHILRRPIQVMVDTTQKYPSVIGYAWPEILNDQPSDPEANDRAA